MKLIHTALLCLLATAAQAAEHESELMYAIATGFCTTLTQPTQRIQPNGATTNVYDANNEDLHRCQYISEMSSSGCTQSGSCPSYRDWTNSNPSISPALPREVFLSRLQARQAKTVSEH